MNTIRLDYKTPRKPRKNALAGSIVSLLAIGILIAIASNIDYSRTKQAQHSQAYINCSIYYQLPCTEQGELRTDLTSQEIRELWDSEYRGDSNFSSFEIMYLQALEENINLPENQKTKYHDPEYK